VGSSIDGLASGLNTTSIIDSLMAVEAQPQTQLKTKLASDQTMISTLQSLNSKLSSLKDLASGDSAVNALNLFSATTSSPSLSATATTSATAGSIDVTVTQLAQSQVDVTAAMSSWPTDGSGAPAHLTLVDSTGNQTEITPASTSLDDVVTAINAASGPARAVKVPAGNGAYRLQLTATTSGAAGAFSVYQGTAAQVSAGTATDLMADPSAAVVKGAQDAKATLYAGTPAAQTITSGTNTFTDLLPGVAVTASAVTATPVTVNIASDSAGITKKAGDLVNAVNDVLGFVSIYSAVTQTTDANGASAASGGIFSGNSGVRSVNDQVFSAMSMPVNGKSPSEYGINVTRDGNFTFDAAKLQSSLASDPAGTQAALQTIASRVSDAATSATDPFTGSVTALIKGQQSEVADLGSQISDWDQRLATRRQTLQSTYNAMEVALGQLNAQQSWLTGQIAGLSTSTK
jgi:flagellar hook-associated protein 2